MSSTPPRRRPRRPSRGRNRPRQRVVISTVVIMAMRSRMPTIRSALVVTLLCSIAAGTYLAFSDDVLTGLIGRQTKMQIPSEDHIAKLREPADLMSGHFLDQRQVEQQPTALLREQVFEQQPITLRREQVFEQQPSALLREQIDRISRALNQQEQQVEQKLATLLQRQAKLEQLTSAFSGDLSATGTIKPERIAPPETTPVEKSTTNEAVNVATRSDAHSQSRELPARAATTPHRMHRAVHHRASLRRRPVVLPQSAAASMAPPVATPAEKGVANQ